jgi:very-short-patch-repair endonuclease
MSRDFARHLRKTMTEAERQLWHHLRHRQLDGSRFRRQAPIGPYIVDFVCFERRLVVELDGGQHARQIEEDATRTRWLNLQGFRVLRFWNSTVFEDQDVVLEAIWDALRSTPHPGPPPQGGREAEDPATPGLSACHLQDPPQSARRGEGE